MPQNKKGGSSNSFSIKNYSYRSSYCTYKTTNKDGGDYNHRSYRQYYAIMPKTCSGTIINKRYVKKQSGVINQECQRKTYTNFYEATCDMSYSYLSSPIYKYKKYNLYKRADNTEHKIYHGGHIYTTYRK